MTSWLPIYFRPQTLCLKYRGPAKFAAALEGKEPLGITYLHGDLSHLAQLPLTESGYDVVLCLMTHLYLDERSFKNSFMVAANYLKVDGRLVYLNIHPLRGKGDSYFTISTHTATLPTLSGELFQTTFFQHPLEIVFSSILQAQLEVARVLEPRPTVEELALYPMLLSGSEKDPSYILIEARRTILAPP